MDVEIEICKFDVENIDEAVKELWLNLAQEMFEIEHFVFPSQVNADRWVKFVRESVAKKRSFLLIARHKDKPVGFALANIHREYPLDVAEVVGTINDVYVLPEFRGRGVGKQLMMKCLELMKSENVNVVRLGVLSENKTAIKLYENLGFNTYKYEMMKRL